MKFIMHIASDFKFKLFTLHAIVETISFVIWNFMVFSIIFHSVDLQTLHHFLQLLNFRLYRFILEIEVRSRKPFG